MGQISGMVSGWLGDCCCAAMGDVGNAEATEAVALGDSAPSGGEADETQ